MRPLILTLCLFALPAAAQNLKGQWRVDIPSQPDYSGVVLVDADGRVTLDSPLDHGRPAKFRGYLERQADGIKIVLTNGTTVAFLYCASELNDRLHCYASRKDGKSDAAILTRVGPGPQNLTRELR